MGQARRDDLVMPTTINRVYFLDWLRVGALGLLILYHTELPYVIDHWVARSAHQVDRVSWLSRFISEWQMALLFLVAGAAMRFSIGRDGAMPALQSRLKRIGPPILFGLLVLAPVQALGAQAAGLRLDGLAEGHQILQHVWFLPFLLLYVAAAALVVAAAPRASGVLERVVLRVTAGRGALVVLAAVLVIGGVAGVVAPRTYAIWDDLAGHVKYGGLFALGVWGGTGLWPRLEAHRWTAAAVLALSAIAWLAIDGVAHQTMHAIAGGVFGAMVIGVLCGFGRRWINRPSALLRELNRAVMPIYLVHQPIIVGLMLALAPLRLSEPLERTALTLGTFALSWAVYRLFDATRLRGLLGLAPPPPRSGQAALGSTAPA